ncbi:hypothetical protein RVIR1_07400 [Candidatus Rickettsiella viridis]|uniref:Uncharacterized protein n=1 Tax=Candidatus Rickettsiella viridis TaxID=676208 RepID=A0A2Z5UUK3_9COXI|nr:hypothetical protein RVIR1_07400 [Candidatus Rickettsiella viridis]
MATLISFARHDGDALLNTFYSIYKIKISLKQLFLSLV